jgi:DNA gyrase subunit A
VQDYAKDKFVLMATRNGTVKKTSLDNFSRPRTTGIIAVELNAGDELVGVAITDGKGDVMLFASNGKSIRFKEADVRPMGRNAAGVRGIQLAKGEAVIDLIIVAEGDVLTATEHGYGKRTPASDYPVQGRGGQGVISIQTTERNGKVVGAIQVSPEAEIMLISSAGTLVRTPAQDISVIGRNTQGVRLIRLAEGEVLVGVDRIEGDVGGENGGG